MFKSRDVSSAVSDVIFFKSLTLSPSVISLPKVPSITLSAAYQAEANPPTTAVPVTIAFLMSVSPLTVSTSAPPCFAILMMMLKILSVISPFLNLSNWPLWYRALERGFIVALYFEGLTVIRCRQETAPL